MGGILKSYDSVCGVKFTAILYIRSVREYFEERGINRSMIKKMKH